MDLLYNVYDLGPCICVGVRGKEVARATLTKTGKMVLLGGIEGLKTREVYDFLVRIAQGYCEIVGAELRVPLPPQNEAAQVLANEGGLHKDTGDQAGADGSVKASTPVVKKKRTPKKRAKEASKGVESVTKGLA